MICFHHNDLDGHCAGAIVRKYIQENFPDTLQKYVEVDYGQFSKDFILSQIVKGEAVYVVDFHFSQEITAEMNKIASKIKVFDHHKTASEVVAQYPKEVELHCDFGSEFSGCELVWNYLYPGKQMPAAVTLIGDRDAWKWVHGKQTASFNAGMVLHSHQPQDLIWDDLLNSVMSAAVSIQVAGEMCLRYRDKICEAYRDMWGYEAELEVTCSYCGGCGGTFCNEPAERDTCIKCGGTGKRSYKCYVLNFVFPGASSEMFGKKLQEYDICVATVFKNGTWKLSFRSEGKVDVSKIAKKFPGGGGHANAAGAEGLTELPFKILKEK